MIWKILTVILAVSVAVLIAVLVKMNSLIFCAKRIQICSF